MVPNPIFTLLPKCVHTALVVDLELSSLDDNDVNIEREGGVGGVQLVIVTLAHHDVLQVGQVCHTRQLIPGKHRAVDAVPRDDVTAAGVDRDVGA